MDQLIQERLKKLEEIKKLKINPYPYKFDKTTDIQNIINSYSKFKAEEKSKDIFSIAGRIILERSMGKAAFLNIQDQTNSIQLYLNQQETKNYSLIKHLDLGDIIGIKGYPFKTKKGELTLFVKELTILTKSLRPLPEKFHGLKDIELIYRHRYLDLITNPESKNKFLIRTKIVQAFREFLNSKGFIEVETPTLQPLYGGANAKPFKTYYNALKKDFYLRISNELYLKRLLIGGFEKVYEFVKDFRNEDIDTTHIPEFTQIEFYEAYKDYNHAMEMYEQLIEFTAKKVLGTTEIIYQNNKISLKTPWKRLSMTEAIKKYAKFDIKNKTKKQLIEFIEKNNIEYKKNSTEGLLIKTIFEETCEKHLIQPTFIIDHPIETTPLCKPKESNPKFVERFEPYIACIEIGNAYSELNDPILQRKLFEEQETRGHAGEEEIHPLDEEFLEALEIGMPPAAGVGIGLDRVVMLFTNSQSIRDVILFPPMKPKE